MRRGAIRASEAFQVLVLGATSVTLLTCVTCGMGRYLGDMRDARRQNKGGRTGICPPAPLTAVCYVVFMFIRVWSISSVVVMTFELAS